MALIFSILGGLTASVLRLPPLIGFLAAGFAVSTMGLDSIPGIDIIADLGVTTLLFTIGLKLNPRDIAGPRVVGTAVGHATLNTLIFVLIFGLAGIFPLSHFAGLSLEALVYIGVATSFSSTVFVMAQLAEQNRTNSSVGAIAIGVLVLQDIIAVVVLVVSSGRMPEPWALALPLLLLLRPLVTRMPDRMFRTELLVLTGVGIAVVSYSFFELAGVSGSLGSLIAGIILSGHPVSDRLFDALMSVRELLLVGFFIEIGLGGLPNTKGFIIAGFLLLFLVVKAAIFMAILSRVGMASRTSALTGLTLGNYSEFGLIVIAVPVGAGILDSSWTSIMAIAVAGSFVIGALVSSHEDKLLPLLVHYVPQFPVEKLAADERPVQVSDVDAIVLGLGRVGEGAYDRLHDEYGMNVFGIEFDEERISEMRGRGYNVIAGDVMDVGLWRRIEFDRQPRMVVLALPNYMDAIKIAQRIRENNPKAVIASTSLERDSCEKLRAAGLDVTVYVYDGAGEELADQTMHAFTSH